MPTDPLLKERLRPLRTRPTAESQRGGLKHPVAAVLFDIYGTLLISASGDIGHADARREATGDMSQWIAKFGYRPPPQGVGVALTSAIKSVHQQQKNKGVQFPEVVIEEIWSQLYPLATVDELRRLALAYELRVNPVWPMPGLSRCLRALRRNGVRLGIISNAQFYTPLILAHFLEEPLPQSGFLEDLCFYSYRYRRAKPGAALYKAAKASLRHYGIAPHEAVMVGNDRRNDVAAAKVVGFQTVLFAGDERSLRWRRKDPDWKTAQPDMVITDLLQLSDRLCI